MKSVLLNAGFGEPLSETDLAWIQGRGFHGVRSDYGPGVLKALFYTRFRPLIIASEGGRPEEYIFDRIARICREAERLGFLRHRPYPTLAIEPINEPDLDPYWSGRPAALSDVIWECWRIAARYSSGITIVTPGISNLTRDALGYLGAMIDGGIPDDVVIGFHRYPVGDDPTAPHPGFKTRHAETNLLKALAGPRRLWCTETGWSTGPRKRAFPFCFFKSRLSEETVAKNAAIELRFWARTTVESVTWYQINDGPNRNIYEDNFGLRTYPDRANKVLARWMPELIQEVACDA